MNPGARRYDPFAPASWCFWRWRPINGDYRGDYRNSFRDVPEPYLLRLYVFMCQLFSVCLHWINFPDPDLDPHDHQRGFVSIVLRGSYVEEVYPRLGDRAAVAALPTVRRVRWFNVKKQGDAHRIVSTSGKVLTLVFHGPRRREWNFWVLDTDGLSRRPVYWRDYTAGTPRES